MNKHEMMGLIESLIDDAKAAVLATVDKQGRPHVRWMTPACLKDRPHTVFMLSFSHSSKVEQVRDNPLVEIMLQTKALDTIVNIRGRMDVIENPSIRNEILECLGSRLFTFWHVNKSESDVVVLEVNIDDATVHVPMKGSKETVLFA